MMHIAWAVLLWLFVLVLIPVQRIKQLWLVGVISFFLLFIVDFIFVQLGYYKFYNELLPIGGIPIAHLIGGAGGGILLMNWMKRNPLYKIILVVFFSGLLSLSELVHIYYGVMVHSNRYTNLEGFVLNIAGLSILVWLSLAAVGEERIYEGNKTRFIKQL